MNRSNATYVKVAQHAVGGADDLLVTLGLGSCVAIMLHDADARVGGMAHVLLPEPALSRDRSNESKFASTATRLTWPESPATSGAVARFAATGTANASANPTGTPRPFMAAAHLGASSTNATVATTDSPNPGWAASSGSYRTRTTTAAASVGKFLPSMRGRKWSLSAARTEASVSSL